MDAHAGILQKARRVFDTALDILVWIAVLLLVLVVLAVAGEVVARFSFNKPQAWVLEFSEYALLFITFLAAAHLVRAEKNITIDIVTAIIGERSRRVLAIFQWLVVCAVSFAFLYFGAKVTADLYVRGIYNPTIVQVPLAYIIFIIPLGGLFIFIQSLMGLWSSLRALGGKRLHGERKTVCSSG